MRNPALMLLAHLLQILVLRLGTPASLTIWVCSILAPVSSKVPNIPFYFIFYYRSLYVSAFSVAQTVLQAMSRAVYAFSRDHGTVHTILR